MFRAVLPRATPRASLRACGPKAVPANLIAPPMFFIGRSRRGYASEAGEFLLLLPRMAGGVPHAFRMRLLISNPLGI